MRDILRATLSSIDDRAGDPAQPLVIIVSGPGGAGKGTLVQQLVERDPRLWLSRSWTTRAQRSTEADDAYVFVDRTTFERHRDAGGFLEWVDFLDYQLGTPLPDLTIDQDVLFEIDVEGGRQLRERFPDALLIFVDAPTRADQRDRLRERGDAEDVIASRLAKAPEEVAAAVELGYHMVVNDDLERATREIQALIETHRAHRRSR